MMELRVKSESCTLRECANFSICWTMKEANLCWTLHRFHDENGKSFDLMEMTIDTMALTKHTKGSVHQPFTDPYGHDMVEISCCCLQYDDGNLIIRSKRCCSIKANDEWQRTRNKSARLPPPSTAASSKVNCAINKIFALIATIACPNIMNDNIKISFIFTKAFSSSTQKGEELSHQKRSWVFKCSRSRRRNFYFTFLFISISHSHSMEKFIFICGMKIALILTCPQLLHRRHHHQHFRSHPSCCAGHRCAHRILFSRPTSLIEAIKMSIGKEMFYWCTFGTFKTLSQDYCERGKISAQGKVSTSEDISWSIISTSIADNVRLLFMHSSSDKTTHKIYKRKGETAKRSTIIIVVQITLIRENYESQ